MNIKRILTTCLLSAVFFFPQVTLADSTSCTGAGCSTAANVNFTITIPTFLRLRVGAVASTDTIVFTPLVGVVGDSSVVAGTGGDLTAGVSTVEVAANNGDVTIATTLTNPGSGLSNAGIFIAWDEVDTAGPSAPILTNAGVVDTTFTSVGNIVNAATSWTYTYANTTIPAAGTYTGTATYTGSIP